jgi:hypothetical protein
MGRAVTAFPGQESAFWNPAGLADLQKGRLVVMRRTDVVGEATAFSLVLARPPLGTVTFSYQFLDLGDQEWVDQDRNVLGTMSSRDHLGIVSFASRVLPWLDAGLNFKVYQSRFGCQGDCPAPEPTGTTYLLDAGILARPIPHQPLRLGVLVAHLGPDLQFINAEQADPLVTRFRLAAAYEVIHLFLDNEFLECWATAEVEERVRDLGSRVVHLGAELSAGRDDRVMVRAGYGVGEKSLSEGLAVGLGLVFQQFEVGIGKTLANTRLLGEAEPAQITFGVIF